MRGVLVRIVVALAMSQTGSAAMNVKIFADTNRDGKVDVNGKTDSTGKCSIGPEEALFLPAITDTDRRCSKNAHNLENEELEKCHDGTDDVLRHPERLAHIRTVPLKNIAKTVYGSIAISCDASFPSCTDKVRLFHRSGTGVWNYLSENHVFQDTALVDGLVLGIDGRDIRRPNKWDGRVTINFNVWDNVTSETFTDCVKMRVSPILTHHHSQTAKRVFTTGSHLLDTTQTQFVKELREHVEANGTELQVFEDTLDIWTQDFFEPGYTSIPGPDGPIGIRVMFRSPQISRSSGRLVFEQLRSADVGAVQYFDRDWGRGHTLDSTGNLETIPPYRNGDANFPAGRVYQGSWGNQKPTGLSFFAAQEAQAPLELDTSFLLVGHVDEFMQFLPAENERGFVVVVDDPRAGMELLLNASAAGHGGVMALSRVIQEYDGPWACLPSDSIDEVLGFDGFTSDNDYASNIIEKNLATLKHEIGLGDGDIFRLPALFYSGWWECPWWQEDPCGNSSDCTATPAPEPLPTPAGGDETMEIQRLKRPGTARKNSGKKNILEAVNGETPKRMTKAKMTRRQENDGPPKTTAFFPGIVNGLVLPNNVVLGPKPWGPIIDDVDIIAQAAVEVYDKAGAKLIFMDDYFSHHVGAGEVHCGSNSWRNADAAWWE